MVVHLIENDFEKLFPAGVDEFPSPVNDDNYIDAWLLNSAFNSLSAIETYLLLYKEAIETPLGADVQGANGILNIPIPTARYQPGKFAIATDTNLLAGYIAKDISIFGIVGVLVSGTAFMLPVTNDWGDTINSSISVGISYA